MTFLCAHVQASLIKALEGNVGVKHNWPVETNLFIRINCPYFKEKLSPVNVLTGNAIMQLGEVWNQELLFTVVTHKSDLEGYQS